MSRRTEIESILERYGDLVSFRGKTFRAIIRPDAFRFSGTSAAESGDVLYLGPAAHKLAPGGTAAAYGTDYFIRRCETVRLAGEELYVRALLTPISDDEGNGIRLLRDGKTFAGARSCRAGLVQGAKAVISLGESVPAGIAGGTAVWALTLTGIYAADSAGLLSAEPFSVSVPSSGMTAVYKGCRWENIEKPDGLRWAGLSTGKALAAEREEEQDGT